MKIICFFCLPFVRGEAEGRGVYGLSINPPVLPHHSSFTKEDKYLFRIDHDAFSFACPLYPFSPEERPILPCILYHAEDGGSDDI